jgi:hypothetical protein
MRSEFFALIILLFFAFTSCVETVENQIQVYSNNFSKLDLANFENGRLFIWLNDTIAGYYHNEEVSVTLKELPPHNYLKVSIEILVHDSWDGNADDGISGPDFWYMGLDQEETYRTTFSNSPCVSTYCLYQSFPNTYFHQNWPKNGSIQVDLPGLCLFGRTSNYTSRYRIEQLIEHTNSEVNVFMGARLMQTNSPYPVCDESWSIGGIYVLAIQTND